MSSRHQPNETFRAERKKRRLLKRSLSKQVISSGLQKHLQAGFSKNIRLIVEDLLAKSKEEVKMEARNYIDGKWLATSNKRRVLSPEDGHEVGVAYDATEEDVQNAVAAARTAFPAWSATSVENRAQVVSRAADLLAQEYGEMGQPTPLKDLIKNEMGKRLPEADIEVIESSDMLRFFADQGPTCLADRPLALNRELWPSKKSAIGFAPLGVVAAIKPWNYPLEIPIWSLGAALTAGNTVVFKPSEITPLVATKLTEIFERAKLPKGVLNVIHGDASIGRALVDNSDINMVTFTGSVPVGKEIALKCAINSVRTSLELGGKDAMIVLDDANSDLALNGALWGAFTNCGQVCVGVRRLLVPQGKAEDFTERLVSAALQLRLGKDIGPLASAGQLEKVTLHVEDALQKGAKLLCGGTRPEDSKLRAGYFFSPTILTATSPDMLVEREDTFGPVVTIKTYQAVEEAIEIANSVEYDLGASIWTCDTKRGLEIARRLRTGMVWVNDVNVAFPQAPWCGYRWSGKGIELSEFAFHEYSVLRHINYETGSDIRRAWWFPYK